MAFLFPSYPFNFRRSTITKSRTFIRSRPASLRSVRCSVEKAGNVADERAARLDLWRQVQELKQSLDLAVTAQRFSDAARLRDQILALSLSDDYFRTKMELECAVREERFADAARLRDALSVLDPPPKESGSKNVEGRNMEDMDGSEVENWSKTKTHGIVVHVESFYMPEQSVPEHNHFMFGYKVTITNESSETCQLVSRQWNIQQTGSKDKQVNGPGVVGKQPVLEPGDSFQYTSGCEVNTPLKGGQSVLGNMRGQYFFCKGDVGAVRFSVNIDPFYLILPFKHFRTSSGPFS